MTFFALLFVIEDYTADCLDVAKRKTTVKDVPTKSTRLL